jgi:hypothetical protein
MKISPAFKADRALRVNIRFGSCRAIGGEAWVNSLQRPYARHAGVKQNRKNL